jgi:O-antigen/teichoic acid export membrane protein
MNNFFKDMAIYLPTKLLPALTGFITVPILTRLFDPSEYGNYALALGVIGFLYAFSSSGFGAAAIRFFPAYKVKQTQGVFLGTLSVSLGIVLAFTVVISVGGLVLLRSSLPAKFFPLLVLSILIFIVEAVFTVYLEIARVRAGSKLYTKFQLFSLYGGLFIGLVLVIGFNFSVEGLLWGSLISFVLLLPALILRAARGISLPALRFQRSDGATFWRYAWPLALGNLAMWGLRLSDRYILGIFRTVDEVGLYSVAYNLSGKSIDILVSMVLLSSGPLLMTQWESKGQEATEKTLLMASRILLILCVPAVVGLVLLAYPFVVLLTSPAYHPGYRIVGYVALSSLVWGASQFASMGLLIQKKTLHIALNQLIAALINLGLNLLFIPRFGFIAAGINTLAGFVILLFLQARASSRYLTWQLSLMTMRNVLLASGIMGIAVIAVLKLFTVSGETQPIALLVSIVTAVPIYFVIIFISGEANKEERMLLKSFWIRLATVLRPTKL